MKQRRLPSGEQSATCGNARAALPAPVGAAEASSNNLVKKLVAVNGQVYIVNKANGSVRRVDLSNARPFTADESDSD